MNLRKAAEMALEIIEGEWPADDEIASPVMYALREALAKPEEYGLRGEALYLHPAPIPEGWQLVPVEPTARMRNAFFQAYFPEPDIEVKIYKAMLAAAPKPGE